jgi:8-oxo-dGTP diphosphatase
VPTERFTVIPAVHLLLVRDSHVLLMRRFNTGYEDGKWSLPAGHLDGNESVTAAVVREAREETGVALDPRDLEVVHIMHRRVVYEERMDFFLLARRWAGHPAIMEPDKCDALGWHDVQALSDEVIPYISAALDAVVRRLPFSEFGWELAQV